MAARSMVTLLAPRPTANSATPSTFSKSSRRKDGSTSPITTRCRKPHNHLCYHPRRTAAPQAMGLVAATVSRGRVLGGGRRHLGPGSERARAPAVHGEWRVAALHRGPPRHQVLTVWIVQSARPVMASTALAASFLTLPQPGTRARSVAARRFNFVTARVDRS